MAKRRTKGNGTIYYDENKKLYVGQITTGYDVETGKRKRQTVTGKTKAAVESKMKNIDFQICNAKQYIYRSA